MAKKTTKKKSKKDEENILEIKSDGWKLINNEDFESTVNKMIDEEEEKEEVKEKLKENQDTNNDKLLCNECIYEFPSCNPIELKFGKGKVKDNVIECDSFSPLDKVSDEKTNETEIETETDEIIEGEYKILPNDNEKALVKAKPQIIQLNFNENENGNTSTTKDIHEKEEERILKPEAKQMKLQLDIECIERITKITLNGSGDNSKGKPNKLKVTLNEGFSGKYISISGELYKEDLYRLNNGFSQLFDKE